MATTYHTLRDIFGTVFISSGEVGADADDGIVLERIVIPMIQRDYAQGRESAEVKRVRERFLEALVQAITDTPITLDLIYGDIDKKGVLTPLDGQQRLTTLFLLHWYAAKKEGIEPDEYDFLNRFSYATRYSARDFCKKLIEFEPGDYYKLSEEIIDQDWFPLDWLHDPTIHSMIVMLDAIDEKFKDVDNIWDSLADGAITFYFLPIEDMGLTDEIYIKMNSRGKPLTVFENFKADFENELRMYDEELASSIIEKIDREWTDMLWGYRGDNNIIDDEFLRYFRFICDIICYKEGDTPQGKSSDVFDLLSKYFAHDNDSLEAHIEILSQYFDCWCEIDDFDSPYDFFVSFLSEKHEEGKVRWDDKLDVFEECLCYYGKIAGNGNRAFPLGNVVMLYAVITYLLNKGKIKRDDFIRRIRVVKNLVENSEFEMSDSTNRTGGNRMPMILEQVDNIILYGKVDTKIDRSFNLIQLKEEADKLVWTKNNPERSEALYALEDHDLLYGRIGVIGIENDDCFDRFISLFDCDYDAIDCALLVTGDYMQRDNDWRYQIGSSMLRGMAWRNLFHQSRTVEGFDKTKDVIVRLLKKHKSFTDDILRGIADEYILECEKNSLFDWRYYYVKYKDSFRPGRYGRYCWVDYENKPYEFAAMWSERYPSTKTYQPFLKEVDRYDNINTEDWGMNLYWEDDTYTVCENDAFVTYRYDEKSNTEEELVDERIDIAQNEDGIDTENRIEKYKKLCWD